MVLRQVKNLWLTRGDSGRIIFRSDEIYDPSSGVYLNQASRVERERCYEQILLRSIPGHEIFFNFDIDTLTIQPCLLRQKREDKDYDLNAPIVRTAERFKLWGPVMTLRILKTLLEDPGNNLERVQGIMVGNFTWEVKRSSDRSYHDEVIRPRELLKHREEFTHALRGGYQNLEELKFVYPDPAYDAEISVDYSPGDEDAIRADIRKMYEEERDNQLKEKKLICNIPKITFFKHDADGVPRFGPDDH